ncbi:hypothetical protein, partial [Streptococcus sanguinis]|uniref:hypothetical protein n=1 Tax=Streptococcus sanguinis TaxID=1305 RepID=UPI001E61126C
ESHFILGESHFILGESHFILGERDFIRQLSLEPQGIARPYNITLQYIYTIYIYIALRAYIHIHFIIMKIKSLRSI